MNLAKRILSNIAPFLIIGTCIALVIAVVVLLSYLLIWGLLIGVIIYAAHRLKHIFSRKKRPDVQVVVKQTGRIIEHEE